jgi:hypothetical protein
MESAGVIDLRLDWVMDNNNKGIVQPDASLYLFWDAVGNAENLVWGQK